MNYICHYSPFIYLGISPDMGRPFCLMTSDGLYRVSWKYLLIKFGQFEKKNIEHPIWSWAFGESSRHVLWYCMSHTAGLTLIFFKSGSKLPMSRAAFSILAFFFWSKQFLYQSPWQHNMSQIHWGQILAQTN